MMQHIDLSIRSFPNREKPWFVPEAPRYFRLY